MSRELVAEEKPGILLEFEKAFGGEDRDPGRIGDLVDKFFVAMKEEERDASHRSSFVRMSGVNSTTCKI